MVSVCVYVSERKKGYQHYVPMPDRSSLTNPGDRGQAVRKAQQQTPVLRSYV